MLALLGHGGFAEQAIARVDDVVPIPEEMDSASRPGFAIAYGTAYGALVWRAGLHRGETLLVHGAAGGVGLDDGRVRQGHGGRRDRHGPGAGTLAVARAHGADEVVDIDDPDLVERLRALANGAGVRCGRRSGGRRPARGVAQAVAWEGRIVVVGFASGEFPRSRPIILLVKNAAVLGFYWGSYRKHDPARLRAAFGRLFDWHEAGRIRPHVSEVLPLARTSEAIERLRRRQATGKLVVDVRQ